MNCHARYAFQVGRCHTGNDGPCLKPWLARLHYRALLHGEVLPAILATQRHGQVGTAHGPHATAVGADRTIRPALLFKPAFGCIVVGKHTKKPNGHQALSVTGVKHISSNVFIVSLAITFGSCIWTRDPAGLPRRIDAAVNSTTPKCGIPAAYNYLHPRFEMATFLAPNSNHPRQYQDRTMRPITRQQHGIQHLGPPTEKGCR